MKKLIFAFLLVSFGSFCFAQSEETAFTPGSGKFNMEVTLGISANSTKSPVPVPAEDAEDDDPLPPMVRSKNDSTVIGIGMTLALSEFVGLALDLDFSLASEQISYSNPHSSSISIFGASAFFGPIFYLYKYNFLHIPLAFGLHMSYWDLTTWIPTLNNTGDPSSGWLHKNDMRIGAGLQVGMHFYFTPNAYMISRVNIAIDFYRMYNMQSFDGEETTENPVQEMSMGWGIKPTIGLGIKIK